jgi:hypothetical protein
MFSFFVIFKLKRNTEKHGKSSVAIFPVFRNIFVDNRSLTLNGTTGILSLRIETMRHRTNSSG